MQQASTKRLVCIKREYSQLWCSVQEAIVCQRKMFARECQDCKLILCDSICSHTGARGNFIEEMQHMLLKGNFMCDEHEHKSPIMYRMFKGGNNGLILHKNRFQVPVSALC